MFNFLVLLFLFVCLFLFMCAGHFQDNKSDYFIRKIQCGQHEYNFQAHLQIDEYVYVII